MEWQVYRSLVPAEPPAAQKLPGSHDIEYIGLGGDIRRKGRKGSGQLDDVDGGLVEKRVA